MLYPSERNDISLSKAEIKARMYKVLHNIGIDLF